VGTIERQLDIRISAATDVGGRAENEDAVVVTDLEPVELGDGTAAGGFLLAVADGMGGHQRGEVASRIAVDTIRDVFVADPAGDIVPLLKQAFRRANELIYAAWHDEAPSQLMGTTLVVAATRGKYATIASIGDSRAYLIRAGRLQQITRDHSLVAEQVSQGHMTEAEARESPHRNIILHALGHKPKLDSKMPNVFEITLLEDDRLLLLTDGFFDVVPDEDLLQVTFDTDYEAVADRLVAIAKERGTTDNVSAIVATAVERPDLTLATAQTSTLSRPARLPLAPIAAAILILILLAIVALLVL
jgi:serine/threonine protein phosphatase PrpC